MNEQTALLANVNNGIKLMVARQYAMNLKVDPEWWRNGFPFHRAAWVEMGEAMQYLRWEWWKNTSDTAEFKNEEAFGHYCLEVVDALHFCISMLLQESIGKQAHAEQASKFGVDNAAKTIINSLSSPATGCHGALFNRETVRRSLVEITEDGALCFLYKLPNNALSYLVEAAIKSGIGFVGLLAFYLAKNELNVFRQDHGYKSGAYVKLWDEQGNEDNLYLARAVLNWLYPLTEDMAFERLFSGQFQSEIQIQLETTYTAVLARQGEPEETVG